MASVLFIICVPYTKNSQNLETDGNGESTSSQIYDQNFFQFMCISDDSALPPDHKPEQTDGDTNKANQTANDVQSLTGPLDLAKVLESELRALNVRGDSWTITNDKEFYQVVFLEKAERVETILERLKMLGIGKRPKSSVSTIPTSIHIQANVNVAVNNLKIIESNNKSNSNAVAITDAENEPLIQKVKKKKKRNKQKKTQNESTKDEFKKSIKSRLTVEQVAQGLNSDARLTFDFVMFTILASFITAVGLAEDSAVVLSASILVSPLMGPIVGGTFGLVIKNKNLRNTGLKTELCGLTISAGVGFLFGCICGPFGASWNSTKGMWPTQEMASRGMLRSLWVGMLISLPSGAGVALSVLGGNISSLVGVAVSASLLAPTVNSGMLLAYSFISTVKPPELLNSSEYNTTMLKCPPFKDNSYKAIYSCDMEKEAAILAVLSLILTIVNIICILITATVVLKIKEVTPKASSTNATQTFWTEDIKIGREAYKTLKGSQAENLLKEWRAFQFGSISAGSRESIERGRELVNMVKQVEETEDYQAVVRRASRGAQDLHNISRNIKRLVKKEDGDANMADKEATILQNQPRLRDMQTYYTAQQRMKIGKQPHISTIFSQPGPEPETKRKKCVREFHVSETENPFNTSVVRVSRSSEESDEFSVTTDTEF